MHAPGTKINDLYAEHDGVPDVDQFCEIVHDSDVAVVSIADYFSFDGFFSVAERYRELYPDDDKLLLPNLELRLPEAVNRDGQSINLHLIFRPDLTRSDANKFLVSLKTQITTGASRKTTTCADLSTKAEFESATVARVDIEQAITHVFGSRIVRQDHLLIVTSAKGDGIRPGGKGSKKRKAALTDEIDKFSDAIYGSPVCRDHFLDVNRFENEDVATPKPVFDGCDAHNFDALRANLSSCGAEPNGVKYLTWIKGDPTYEGLLQTLIEPATRVRQTATEPDVKQPYKVISKVKFSGGTDFPSEVLFNPGLNSIIGSRSSGKSALLAFIAHAVDPESTISAQVEASKLGVDEVGPAAGKTWSDVEDVTCEVEWGSGGLDASGRVIYIPQNSLYEISEQPQKVTERIGPVLFRAFPDVATIFDQTKSAVDAANEDVRTHVEEWFSLTRRVAEAARDLRDLGEAKAIEQERDKLQGEIDKIKVAAQLSNDEVDAFQKVTAEIQTRRDRMAALTTAIDQLGVYAVLQNTDSEAVTIPGSSSVSIQIRPATSDLPESVAAKIEQIRDEAVRTVGRQVEEALTRAVTELSGERTSLDSALSRYEQENAELISKHKANVELSQLVAKHKSQVDVLTSINKKEEGLSGLRQKRKNAVSEIVDALTRRQDALASLEDVFGRSSREVGNLTFEVETNFTTRALEQLSTGIDRRVTSTYIPTRGSAIAIEAARSEPGEFMNALTDGSVKCNSGSSPVEVATKVLSATEEIRFAAELDGDRIGGFSRSSMTPGKQALFALTLILNESDEPWPLLIDQPEDDLDSRSIYDTIVPYLAESKRDRQIIMASHNANLVIGADSEEVIVANRHGVDRPNRGSHTFEYLTGSLEHSQRRNDASRTILGRFGIREHACEILDGGEEAFQKRRDKYKI